MPKGNWNRKGWGDYPPPLQSGECLRWQGPHHSQGYGLCGSREYGTPYAHRAAWIREHGSIPDDLVIDHVVKRGCQFRDCVNVAHLEPVTQQENLERGSAQSGDWGQAEKTHCPQGHEYTPENTYVFHRKARTVPKPRAASTERHCKKCRTAAKLRYQEKCKGS